MAVVVAPSLEPESNGAATADSSIGGLAGEGGIAEEQAGQDEDSTSTETGSNESNILDFEAELFQSVRDALTADRNLLPAAMSLANEAK